MNGEGIALNEEVNADGKDKKRSKKKNQCETKKKKVQRRDKKNKGSNPRAPARGDRTGRLFYLGIFLGVIAHWPSCTR